MLKFVAMGQIDDQKANLTFIPPCEGHYENIMLQFQQKSGGEDPFFFYLGPKDPFELINSLPESVTEEVLSADWTHNAVTLISHFVQEEAAGNIASVMTNHWGSERIKIDKDDYLHMAIQLGSDTQANAHFIITADFVPKQGAFYQYEHMEIDFDGSTGLQRLHIPVLVSLENVNIKVALHGDTTQVAAEGVFVLQRFQKDERVVLGESDFGGVVVGDILETLPVVDFMRHAKNKILEIPISFVSGGANMLRGEVNIPNLYAGQTLAYDFSLWEGAIAALDVRVSISGIVKYKHYSNDGDFLKGSGYLNVGENFNE